jgi:hypothetical protein
MGNFVVDHLENTVVLDGGRDGDMVVVDPDLFGENAAEAVRLFTFAFDQGKTYARRKIRNALMEE